MQNMYSYIDRGKESGGNGPFSSGGGFQVQAQGGNGCLGGKPSDLQLASAVAMELPQFG